MSAARTSRQIAEHIGGELEGEDVEVTGLAMITEAQRGELTFIGDVANARKWGESSASAALVKRGLKLEAGQGRSLIWVDHADYGLAKALELFLPEPVAPEVGVHRSALVHPTAVLGADVRIGAGCVIGAHVRIGARTVLHPNVTILDHSEVGEDGELWPGVVIRERCRLGDRCLLQPNVILGSDGFGLAPTPDGGVVNVPHIGVVQLGNDVELGAGTCVDRGKFSATFIDDGCKIDNQCQIAHNCRLGKFCVISGQSGLAGSVTVGDGVMMGGRVAVRDHVTIGAGARIAATSAVMNDVPPGETWGGYPAKEGSIVRREMAAIRKLPDMVKLLKKEQRREAREKASGETDSR